MKQNYKLLLLFSFLFSISSSIFSQTVSFNTQTLGTGFVGNNGSSGISFVVQNTNTFPAVLTSVSNFFTTGGTGNYTLWYSTTSTSGGPIVLTTPTWSPVASVTGVTITGGTQTTLFPLLAFSIPAGATYRFYIESSLVTAPTFTYTGLTNPTGVSPLIFSNSGVNLMVGEYLIGGQIVGWGGLVNNPRAFTGSISLNLLSSPCVGAPTAGTASALPNNPCPGIPVTLSLAGTTSASGLIFQWQRASSPTGPWTTTGLTTATTNPSFYTPAPGTTTWYRCIVTCTNSGLNDTSNVTGAVIVQNWSPTSTCWCVPTYANGGTQDHIVNISMGTLNNNTAAAGNPSPYFTNYTPLQTGPTPTLSTPNLTPGIPTNISISYGTDPNQYGAVWIDFNHDGILASTEYFSPGTNAGASGTHTFPITAPYTSSPGITRMRVRAGDDVQMSSNQACGPTNSTWGETEDYLVNILPTGPYDPAVSNPTLPIGNFCPDSNQSFTAQVCNFGTSSINLALHPVYVSFVVNGPTGIVTYVDTLNTGTLAATGIGCLTAQVNPVNMFAGGNYSINIFVSCPGLTNSTLVNDSLPSAVNIMNYRPTAGPDYPLCQFSSIPFGQGLTVGGCSAPLNDSITINFTILGPCNDGTNDATSCQFATGTLPGLIAGASITGGVLTLTNLATISSSYMSEMRFNIYGTSPTGANIFSPGVISPGAGATTSPNYTYTRPISGLQLSNLYTTVPVGNPVNIGYWESYNDVAGSSDISINAGGNPTVVSLKIYYQYVPPAFAWYDVPSGGTSLYSLSPFNPLLFTNAVVNNSNTPGTFTFYAACLGLPTCRVPVNLKINPTPAACQDTMISCEYAVGANNADFDLCTMNNFVSCFNTAATVEYFGDQALITQLLCPHDTSSTNVVYSKVSYAATGCYSSDTLLLQVSSIPQFALPISTGFACAPNSLDISNMISLFSPNPVDTTYFTDAALTIPYAGNPHVINTATTIYVVATTSDSAHCADTCEAIVSVLPATDMIVNQTAGNYSTCGSVGCGNISLTDGNTETLYTTLDCRRVATVKDSVDAIDLGVVSICEDIDCADDPLIAQPYVNRHYEITPTTNGKAIVCLYYLDDDFTEYNNQAFPSWPSMDPYTNLCINQVDNGDIHTPGHTAISIPNSAITSSYDPTTTVWTICFPVDSFSNFYCATCNPLNTPLPVNLTTFTGKRVDAVSELKWETSSEENNSHFIVQRSKDAKNFSVVSSKINSKAPGGNSSSKIDYAYTDSNPISGHNYYRLQQVDIDGHESYSSTIDVYFGNETLVTLFPNPVTSDLNIDINIAKATNAFVKIMDAAGRNVKTVEMPLEAGHNVNSIDISELSSGIYLVQISNYKGLNFSQTIRKK